MRNLVFVFGTLKEGFPNYGVNRGQRVAGTFRTQVRYPLYLVGERRSPWLLDVAESGNHVRGQVFEVDDSVLHEMDVLERVAEPDGYKRAQVHVVKEADGCVLEAFAYLKEPAQFQPFAHDAIGPLSEYTLAQAATYRPRNA